MAFYFYWVLGTAFCYIGGLPFLGALAIGAFFASALSLSDDYAKKQAKIKAEEAAVRAIILKKPVARARTRRTAALK